ncbi:MAG: hypothetical protein R2685_10860 [Candidatus Nitrosocosmicus sp.]|nr:hypothetical protein [Candidatus Nitrosocosmicus sp.]
MGNDEKPNKVDFAQVLLDKITKEKKDREEERENKKRANEFVGKIFASLQNCVTRRVIDPKTKRVIGYKFKYTTDGEGKSIYDYICYNKDEFEKKILEKMEFTFDPKDEKDGGWIDKRVEITWLNTRY